MTLVQIDLRGKNYEGGECPGGENTEAGDVADYLCTRTLIAIADSGGAMLCYGTALVPKSYQSKQESTRAECGVSLTSTQWRGKHQKKWSE